MAKGNGRLISYCYRHNLPLFWLRVDVKSIRDKSTNNQSLLTDAETCWCWSFLLHVCCTLGSIPVCGLCDFNTHYSFHSWQGQEVYCTYSNNWHQGHQNDDVYHQHHRSEQTAILRLYKGHHRLRCKFFNKLKICDTDQITVEFVKWQLNVSWRVSRICGSQNIIFTDSRYFSGHTNSTKKWIKFTLAAAVFEYIQIESEGLWRWSEMLTRLPRIRNYSMK